MTVRLCLFARKAPLKVGDEQLNLSFSVVCNFVFIILKDF